MLTPQEVAERTFKAHFGGYPMDMVDAFLDVVTHDYTTLYKENTTLKAKMKVLADKVEEYRSTEDAMRKALLSAQQMADRMVAEAKVQKEKIVGNAEQEAAERLAEIQQEIESEKLRLTAAKNATAAYVARLTELFEHERDYLNNLSDIQAERVKPDTVSDTAQAIGAAVEKAMEEELLVLSDPTIDPASRRLSAEESEEPTIIRKAKGSEEQSDQEDSEEEKFSSQRIDFQNLQFGKDFEIG